MPPYHRRTSYPRRGTARRKTAWVTDASTTPQALAAATSKVGRDVLLGFEVAGASTLGATVMRVHYSLNVASVDADTQPSVQFGFLVWDKTAVVAGSPVTTDYYADWMMLRFLTPGTADAAVQTPATGGGAYAPTGIIWGKEYDIKSRRRLHQMNDTLIMCVENFGTSAIEFSYVCRTLLALP